MRRIRCRTLRRIVPFPCTRVRANGVVIYYMTFAMIVLCGFCSFAVDLGRVQVTKAELRRAADSASRAAAAELPNLPSAIFFAMKYANSNMADGTPIKMDPIADIEFGKWDTKKATFTKLTGFAAHQRQLRARHAAPHRQARQRRAVALRQDHRQDKCDVTAESYAMLIPKIDVNQNVPGTANPFLAGMPAGSIASHQQPAQQPGLRRHAQQSAPVAAGRQHAARRRRCADLRLDRRHRPSRPEPAVLRARR